METTTEKITITSDEANSQHVDDLLKRQMSLRGEGVTAEPRRRWYFQNWLLFMVVGLVFAIGAWAIIEPVFDDYHYIQGKVEAFDPGEVLGVKNAEAAPNEENAFAEGWVQIRGQKVWLAPSIREVNGSHAMAPFDPSTLQLGQEVGVHTKFYAGARSELAIAHYIDPRPATKASGKALESLRDQSERSSTMGILIFSIVAGMIGLGIGAADGIVCRLPRRALLGGIVGALIGFVGGLVSHAVATVFYIPLSHIAREQLASPSEGMRAIGFLMQMVARMFAWTLGGCAMGLGQGVALRSRRLLAYGFLGGVIGGLLGGLLFDPIDQLIVGSKGIGAEWSRLVGFGVIGAAVGLMIGVVELLSRDAWLRMTEGPLAGKEFLMFRDIMNIGASPKSEIYLFNDDKVAPTHATLRAIGDECEISARDKVHPLLINNNAVKTARLRHGDRITIGRTSFVFEQRQR